MSMILATRESDPDGNGGSPELCRMCGTTAMPAASRMRHVRALQGTQHAQMQSHLHAVPSQSQGDHLLCVGAMQLGMVGLK